MPSLALWNWRKDPGVLRIMVRINKHLFLEEKEFVHIDTNITSGLNQLDATKVFVDAIEFMRHATAIGNDLYEISHDSDVIEMRALRQLDASVAQLENELVSIRQLASLAGIGQDMQQLGSDQSQMKKEETDLKDFILSRRKQWNMELQQNASVFQGFSPYSNERLSKKLIIETRKTFDDYFSLDEMQKRIAKVLPEMDKKHKEIMQKRDTVGQNAAAAEFRDDIRKLVEAYPKVIALVKEEQQKMEEIYKIDFVLMKRLVDRLHNFKTNVLDWLKNTGFDKLTLADLDMKKVELPDTMRKALQSGVSPQQILTGAYAATSELISGLMSKLVREEFAAAQAA